MKIKDVHEAKVKLRQGRSAQIAYEVGSKIRDGIDATTQQKGAPTNVGGHTLDDIKKARQLAQRFKRFRKRIGLGEEQLDEVSIAKKKAYTSSARYWIGDKLMKAKSPKELKDVQKSDKYQKRIKRLRKTRDELGEAHTDHQLRQALSYHDTQARDVYGKRLRNGFSRSLGKDQVKKDKRREHLHGLARAAAGRMLVKRGKNWHSTRTKDQHEETINELSTKLLKRYQKKAVKQVQHSDGVIANYRAKHGQIKMTKALYGDGTSRLEKHRDRINRRTWGYDKAERKLDKRGK